MIINTSQGKAEMISLTYLEHIAKSFDNVLTHLHHMMLDVLAFQNLQHTTGAIYKIHHHDEFGFLDLIEWLVTCDNPLYQKLFKLLLVPWSLLNVLAAEEIKKIGFMYTSPCLLKFKCFLDRVHHGFASHCGVTVTGHAVSGMVLGFCTLTQTVTHSYSKGFDYRFWVLTGWWLADRSLLCWLPCILP